MDVPLRRVFTYGVPEALQGRLSLASRVLVPFGRRKAVGIVVQGLAEPPEGVKVKAVLALLDERPIFAAELFAFLQEAARYYLHPVGEVLRMAAPALPKEALTALRQRGALSDTERVKGSQLGTRTMLFVRPVPDAVSPQRLGKAQKVVWALALERGEISVDELGRHVRNARSVVRALTDKGLLTQENREVAENPFFASPVERRPGPTPNPEQAVAIETIVGNLATGGGFLLYGVTGSGKTEVYLQVIAQALEQGRGALVLVPEIALTPQLVQRFRERFGDAIAVIHSELTERARDTAYRGLRAGRLHVAIGARSALFAPVQNLGVVVVDEEHDGSFKQEEGFRYQGRDMALLRAHRAGAVCVLGSATPSLESELLAQRGRLTRLTLTGRAAGQAMPPVELVDLQRYRSGPTGHHLLSAPLYRGLEACLANQGQAILFLNRRGFAPALRCASCGQVQECPACSVALTLHRGPGLLRCHYCDFLRGATSGCLQCNHGQLEELGLGTEQLESMVKDAFPEARVARLDRDTASGRGVEEIMERLRQRELDVLIGTQMVTKGHDLPGVTLVGVILADQSLAFPDFRAPERTFQLLSQVAGRAGRGEQAGRVLLQTYQPDQPVLRWAQKHDFSSFCAAEMQERSEHGFPPFQRLVAVRVDAVDEGRAKDAARLLAQVALADPAVQSGQVGVLGPAPAPITRIRARYRYRFLLRSPERPPLRAVALRIVERIEAGLGPVRASVDVDPVNML